MAWAGTYMSGIKYWHANWDSAVLDWFEKDIDAGFQSNGINLKSSIDPGRGYLAGPLFGYQTDDGTWSVSLALMMLSDFSQDWDGRAGAMDLDTDVDTRRRDIDVAASYALAGFRESLSLFKYMKLFVGYKYQQVDYDLDLSYDTMMGQRQFEYKLDAEVHLGTIGAGVAYPIIDKFAIGLQAGVGLALIELEMEEPDGSVFDISPSASFTYNMELITSYTPIPNLILQLGYRAQLWHLEARSPTRWEQSVSEDWTYGPTFTVVYAF
jgi:hypothetical protein